MDGFGLLAGGLGESLCSPAGGRRQLYLCPQHLKDLYDAVDSGGLTGTRATCHDHDAISEGLDNRFLLVLRQDYAFLFLKVVENLVHIIYGIVHLNHGKFYKPFGDVVLRHVKGLEVHGGVVAAFL